MGQVYKNAGIEAARVAGRDPVMDRTALRVKGVVLAVAAPHTKTGSYASRIRIREVPGKSGVRDRLVESTDPQSLAIEYGHWWVTPQGRIIKYIKGTRIFNRAYELLAGK